METYRGCALLVTDDGEVAAVVDVVLHPVPDAPAGSSWTGSAESLAADWPALFEIGEMILRIGERVSRCYVMKPLEEGALMDATLSGLEPPPFG